MLEELTWPEVSEAWAAGCDLVRPDRVEAGYLGGLEAALPVIFRGGLHTFAVNGVLGDPRGMSAGLGVKCLDAISDLLADYFSSLLAWQQPAQQL